MLTPPEISYFSIGGFPIYYYGIILAVAIFVGIVIANWIAIKHYTLYCVIPNIATHVVLWGIVGARVYYCILNWDFYSEHLLEIFALREGGLSIHGALIAGACVVYYEAKRRKMDILKLFDICAMGLPIAQAIGRWGNFFNSEAFGLPTDLPWKMYIAKPFRPDAYFNNEYFHPTFLYESLLNIVIFIILYKIILPKHKEHYGFITAWYLILYSVARIFTEALRVDCVKYVFGIPFPIIISLALIIGAGMFLYKRSKKITPYTK